jgi:hypothetical protein
MIKGKRGDNTLLYFRVICLIIAIGSFIIILSFVIDAYKNTLLEKNYRARDIALLITTMYASPSGVNFTYPIDGGFDIAIGGGEVIVKDGHGAVNYWYLRPEAIKDVTLMDGSPAEMKGLTKNKLFFQKSSSSLMVGVLDG